MAITKKRRQELLAEYTDLLEQSQAIFLTEFTALEVKQMEDLRNRVLQAEGRFHVTKNTLLSLALENTENPVPAELLTGQTATAFALGTIPDVAKAFVDFAKERDTFAIKGGILNKRVITTAEVEALANLPTLDQLRAQIIGLINAPAQNVTSVVANGVRQVINVVDAYVRQQEEGTEAEPAA